MLLRICFIFLLCYLVCGWSRKNFCIFPLSRLLSLLQRRYFVQQQLGRGAFGLVYQVSDRLNDRKMALKMFMSQGKSNCFSTVAQLGSKILFKESELPQLIYERSSEIQKKYFVEVFENIPNQRDAPATMTMELLPKDEYSTLPHSESDIRGGLLQQYLLFQALDSMRVLLDPVSPLVHRDFHLGNVQFNVKNWQFKLYDFSIAEFCDEKDCMGRDFRRIGFWLLTSSLYGGSISKFAVSSGLPLLLQDFIPTPRSHEHQNGFPPPPVASYTSLDPDGAPTSNLHSVSSDFLPASMSEWLEKHNSSPNVALLWNVLQPNTTQIDMERKLSEAKVIALEKIIEKSPEVVWSNIQNKKSYFSDTRAQLLVEESESKNKFAKEMIAAMLSQPNVKALSENIPEVMKRSSLQIEKLDNWLDYALTRRDLLHSYVLFKQRVVEIASGVFDFDYDFKLMQNSEKRALQVQYKSPIPWLLLNLGDNSGVHDNYLSEKFFSDIGIRKSNFKGVQFLFSLPKDEELSFIWNTLRIAREVDNIDAGTRSNSPCSYHNAPITLCEPPPMWVLTLAAELGCLPSPPPITTSIHISRIMEDEDEDLNAWYKSPVGVLNSKVSVPLINSLLHPLALHESDIKRSKPIELHGIFVGGADSKFKILENIIEKERNISKIVYNQAMSNARVNLTDISIKLDEILDLHNNTSASTNNGTVYLSIPHPLFPSTKMVNISSHDDIDLIAWELVVDALKTKFEAQVWLSELSVYPLQPQNGASNFPFSTAEENRLFQEINLAEECLEIEATSAHPNSMSEKNLKNSTLNNPASSVPPSNSTKSIRHSSSMLNDFKTQAQSFTSRRRSSKSSDGSAFSTSSNQKSQLSGESAEESARWSRRMWRGYFTRMKTQCLNKMKQIEEKIKMDLMPHADSSALSGLDVTKLEASFETFNTKKFKYTFTLPDYDRSGSVVEDEAFNRLLPSPVYRYLQENKSKVILSARDRARSVKSKLSSLLHCHPYAYITSRISPLMLVHAAAQRSLAEAVENDVKIQETYDQLEATWKAGDAPLPPRPMHLFKDKDSEMIFIKKYIKNMSAAKMDLKGNDARDCHWLWESIDTDEVRWKVTPNQADPNGKGMMNVRLTNANGQMDLINPHFIVLDAGLLDDFSRHLTAEELSIAMSVKSEITKEFFNRPNSTFITLKSGKKVLKLSKAQRKELRNRVNDAVNKQKEKSNQMMSSLKSSFFAQFDIPLSSLSNLPDYDATRAVIGDMDQFYQPYLNWMSKILFWAARSMEMDQYRSSAVAAHSLVQVDEKGNGYLSPDLQTMIESYSPQSKETNSLENTHKKILSNNSNTGSTISKYIEAQLKLANVKNRAQHQAGLLNERDEL